MKFNPSHADRWVRCPASVKVVENYPPVITSYKNEGIAAHKLLEQCIGKTASDYDLYLHTGFDVNGEKIIITPKILNSVKKAADYIRTIAAEYSTILTEQNIKSFDLMAEGITGAVDVLLMNGTDAQNVDVEIIDYKYGFTPVDVTDNWQLIIYAFGVYELLWNLNVLSFKLTIVQPNNELKGLPIVSSVVLTKEELLEKKHTIVNAIELAKSYHPYYVAGERQCHWCPAKGGCRAYIDYTTKLSNVSINVENVAQQAVNININELSNDKLREIFEASPMIRKMLESVESEVMRRFENGDNIEGMKIVKGSGRRTWAFSDEAMAIKLNKLGIPKELVYEKKLLSLNKACELKWKKRNGDIASLSKRQIETLEKEYVKTGAGKNIVALESDPRAAVELSVKHLFNPIVPQELPDWI